MWHLSSSTDYQTKFLQQNLSGWYPPRGRHPSSIVLLMSTELADFPQLTVRSSESIAHRAAVWGVRRDNRHHEGVVVLIQSGDNLIYLSIIHPRSHPEEYKVWLWPLNGFSSQTHIHAAFCIRSISVWRTCLNLPSSEGMMRVESKGVWSLNEAPRPRGALPDLHADCQDCRINTQHHVGYWQISEVKIKTEKSTGPLNLNAFLHIEREVWRFSMSGWKNKNTCVMQRNRPTMNTAKNVLTQAARWCTWAEDHTERFSKMANNVNSL